MSRFSNRIQIVMHATINTRFIVRTIKIKWYLASILFPWKKLVKRHFYYVSRRKRRMKVQLNYMSNKFIITIDTVRIRGLLLWRRNKMYDINKQTDQRFTKKHRVINYSI